MYNCFGWGVWGGGGGLCCAGERLTAVTHRRAEKGGGKDMNYCPPLFPPSTACARSLYARALFARCRYAWLFVFLRKIQRYYRW